MQKETTKAPYIVLAPSDHYEVGPEVFGAPGLRAIEAIGPFAEVAASGPLITVHDSYVQAHLGIGHHPHRYNERLFYIMAGELDHDDALNQIKGHMGTGDAGLFTEGRRGMLHSEWNHGDSLCHAYILVYSTDPIPEKTAFTVLKDNQAPRYDEGAGVHTKEIVGPRSSLKVHGDIRRFTDSTIENGHSLDVALDDREGGLLSVQEGRLQLNGQELEPGTTVLIPTAEGKRSLSLQAIGSARLLRVVHGPGHGFLRRSEARIHHRGHREHRV